MARKVLFPPTEDHGLRTSSSQYDEHPRPTRPRTRKPRFRRTPRRGTTRPSAAASACSSAQREAHQRAGEAHQRTGEAHQRAGGFPHRWWDGDPASHQQCPHRWWDAGPPSHQRWGNPPATKQHRHADGFSSLLVVLAPLVGPSFSTAFRPRPRLRMLLRGPRAARWRSWRNRNRRNRNGRNILRRHEENGGS